MRKYIKKMTRMVDSHPQFLSKAGTRFACIFTVMPFTALFFISTPGFALPIDARQLSGDEFKISEIYQDDLLVRTSDWSFRGSEASFDKFWEKKDTGDYTTGRRVLSNTDTSYSLKFDAKYEDRIGNYDEDLIKQNSARTGGEEIPDDWRSNTGYKSPSNFNLSFQRDYSLQKKDFSVGVFGCPKTASGDPVSHCEVVETWFSANAMLSADLEATGDLTDNVWGDENVTIQARADRVTSLKVNDFTLATLAEIDSTRSDFKLIEDTDFNGSLSATGTIGVDKNGAKLGISITPSIVWNPKAGDEHAQTNLSYTKPAIMERYENAGLADNYKVEIVDTPDMLATISGSNFTAASVFSEIGLSQLEEKHRVIAAPVLGGITTQSIISSARRQLKIPRDNFVTDVTLPFSAYVYNRSNVEVTLDSIGLDIIEEDNRSDDGAFGLISGDDPLGSYLNSLSISLNPKEFFSLNFDISIPARELVLANDNFFFLNEGSHLELGGLAQFTFTDIYGTRTRNVNIAFVPEPSSLLLFIGAGLIGAGAFKIRNRSMKHQKL